MLITQIKNKTENIIKMWIYRIYMNGCNLEMLTIEMSVASISHLHQQPQKKLDTLHIILHYIFYSLLITLSKSYAIAGFEGNDIHIIFYCIFESMGMLELKLKHNVILNPTNTFNKSN